jgi:thioredoxin reductase (NADPH)
MEKIYDMVIVGGGPAGYTAALYAARAGLDAVLLEKLTPGGQMTQSHWVDNYPGFEEGIEGFALAMKMQQGAERFGAKTQYAEVTGLELQTDPKVVETTDGKLYARTVVLSTGAGPRELGLPREQDLVGRGVAYCAACDGMFYRGKTVAVVGGGNSAVSDAILLSRVAEKVILIHRRDALRADKIYHDQLTRIPNLELLLESQVTALHEEDVLTGVTVRNNASGEESFLPLQGLFVSVGRKPATALVADQLPLDRSGYIIAGESTKTALEGVYAVGDVRTKDLRQIVTAVADGAVAVHHAQEYLASL